MGLYKGKVVSIDDEHGGDRIKVNIKPLDNVKTLEQIPYAFPLLPKTFFVKPKVGESALIITPDNSSESTRYYVGPVIMQDQSINMEYDTSTVVPYLENQKSKVYPDIHRIPAAKGAVPEDGEVCVRGRGNSDIIFSDNDVRIRCGAKLISGDEDSKTKGTNVSFNSKGHPAFLKLKYYENGLKTNKSIRSTATLVGQKINLISTQGDPYFDVRNSDGQIPDDVMDELIKKAHQLPYGDKLVEFLKLFVQAFKSHTHPFPMVPPCADSSYIAVDSYPLESILSNDVRIN